MRTAVTALALLGLLCGSAAAADVGSLDPTRGVPVVDAAQAELVAVQTEVRQALLDAAVEPAQASELLAHVNSFVRQYTAMVKADDEDIRRLSLDEYVELKVVPRLEAASLVPAESERILALVRNWIGLELSVPTAPTARLDREVRR